MFSTFGLERFSQGYPIFSAVLLVAGVNLEVLVKDLIYTLGMAVHFRVVGGKVNFLGVHLDTIGGGNQTKVFDQCPV